MYEYVEEKSGEKKKNAAHKVTNGSDRISECTDSCASSWQGGEGEGERGAVNLQLYTI